MVNVESSDTEQRTQRTTKTWLTLSEWMNEWMIEPILILESAKN